MAAFIAFSMGFAEMATAIELERQYRQFSFDADRAPAREDVEARRRRKWLESYNATRHKMKLRHGVDF
jgi:hypothetical protein